MRIRQLASREATTGQKIKQMPPGEKKFFAKIAGCARCCLLYADALREVSATGKVNTEMGPLGF